MREYLKIIGAILVGAILVGGIAYGASTQLVTITDTAGNLAAVSGGALNVNASITPSGTQDVNIKQTNGGTVAVGHGTAATALRVELPTDGTGVVGLNAGAAVVGKVGIDQTTPGTTNRVQDNLDQVAGASIAQGHGTAATAIRVELPTDGTGVVSLGTGAATIGALTANQSVNTAQIAGTTTSTGNGTTGAGTQRVTISSDSTGQVAIATGTNTIGSAIITTNTTGNGTTKYHAVVPNNTTGVVVKASAGVLCGIQLSNTSSTLGVLHVYDASSAPTAGAGTIVMSPIDPGPAAGGGGGNNVPFPNGCIPFSTGIAYTFTTGIADTDTGVPAASSYSIDMQYH